MKKMFIKDYLDLPDVSELCNINIEKSNLYIKGESLEEIDKKYCQIFSVKSFYKD